VAGGGYLWKLLQVSHLALFVQDWEGFAVLGDKVFGGPPSGPGAAIQGEDLLINDGQDADSA
jgi:hypothetical protein